MTTNRIDQWMDVISLTRGKEKYIFLYDKETRAECLRILGRFATNPELSFNWHDAAALSQKMLEIAKQDQRRTER